MNRETVMNALRATASLCVAAFVVRIVFADPIDKHFIAGLIGGAVALFLCLVFLVPVLFPNPKPTRPFLWNAYQRAKGAPRTPPGDTDEEQP